MAQFRRLSVPHCAYLMIVEEGTRGVLMARQGAEPTLPRIDDWDGDTASLAAFIGGRDSSLEGRALPAWRRAVPRLTVLALLAEVSSGEDDDASFDALYLCEPSLGVAVPWHELTRWTDTDPDPVGVPSPLVAALRAAYLVVTGDDRGEEDGVCWPRFCLPGATAAIAEALASDHVAAPFAMIAADDAASRPTDLQQLQGWCLSSVWRNANVVLKVAHPAWPAEPAINRYLHGATPHLVEEVVASGFLEGGQHDRAPWMLQRRAHPRVVTDDEPGDDDSSRTDGAGSTNGSGQTNGPSRTDTPERQQRLELLTIEALAEFQIAMTGQGDALLAVGVIDRSIEAVTAELAGLWESPELVAMLEPAERASLPALDAHLRERLEELAALAPVPCLTHGDLHLGNVVEVEDGSVRFIDWTDAALSWPGVDLRMLLPPPSDATGREALIAAYERAVAPDIAGAVRLGVELAPLFYALTYAKIDAFLPPSARWHFSGTTTRMIRLLAKQVPT